LQPLGRTFAENIASARFFVVTVEKLISVSGDSRIVILLSGCYTSSTPRRSEHMSYDPEIPDEMPPYEASATERLRATASEVRAKASEVGRKTADKAEQVRAGTASGMDSAADTLHERAERVAGATHSAADALEASADYIREHDLRSMMVDLMEVVKNNPGPALLSAAAVGFLVGRAFTRD
jgi:ElaB/YqjD/DUF883 family membrane-anchored ribosome-binding protein